MCRFYISMYLRQRVPVVGSNQSFQTSTAYLGLMWRRASRSARQPDELRK